MNVDVRSSKTDAEKVLASAFAATRDKLPGKGAVAALREDAFKRFDARGLPHRRIEEWKYTDLRALMREAKPLADPAGTKPKDVDIAPVANRIDATLVTIVNGRYEPSWGSSDVSDPRITLAELFKFLAENPEYKLGQTPGNEDTALSLNTALMTGGIALRVKKGTSAKKPIHIAHVFFGHAAAVYPRSLVIVEPHAQLTVIESYCGPQGLDYQVNSALELVIGDGAQVTHIKIGCDGDQALRVSSLGVTVGGEANYKDFTFTLGGAVVRNQTFVRFSGEGTVGLIDGASLLRGKQHVDNTLVVNHVAGGCFSRERFKSVLDDESRAIFQGKIIVEPLAQKTDAKMMTRALILSDEAEADNKPELEIFADDVQCGHGATAGPLDKTLKFYLMSRGIPENEAEALLIRAFIGEVVEDVAHEALREAIMVAALKWLENGP